MSLRGVFNDVIIDTKGNTLANAQVDVFEYNTTTPVSIYSVRSGGSPISNPIITSSTGLVYFFAEPGTYSVRVSDTLGPARFSTRTFVWDSISGDVSLGGIAQEQIEPAGTNERVLTTNASGDVDWAQIR